MWIEQLPNGKYKYNERYIDPATGKRRKVSLTHHKNTAQVHKQMTRLLNDKIDEKLKEKQTHKNIPFNQLIDEWFVIQRQKIKANSKRMFESRIDIIKRYFTDYTVDKITAPLINKFLLSLYDKGLKFVTVQTYLMVFKQVLRFGYRYGYFEEEITNALHVEKINLSVKDDNKYLELDEIKELDRLLKQDNEHELARLCRIQILTGMRINELLALDYTRHIDFENKTILIERTYVYKAKLFNTPKNGKSRTIYISDEVVDLLKEQVAYAKILTIKHANIKADNTLLFKNRNGEPVASARVNFKLKKYPINGKKITTHYFRHTFITMMVANNVPAHLIAQQVGHANTAMIEQVYRHFSNEMVASLKQAVEQNAVIL